MIFDALLVCFEMDLSVYFQLHIFKNSVHMEWPVCPFLIQTRLPSANGSSRGMNNIWVVGTRNLQSPQHSQLRYSQL